jgi:hypothetical protein
MTRAELNQREALARECADDEAVDRVITAAKAHWLPRGGSRKASEVVDLPIAGARFTFSTLMLALREAPLVVVVLIAVFLASETWQFFARLDGWQYAKVLGGLGVVMAAILVIGLQAQARAASMIPRSQDDDDDPEFRSDELEDPLEQAGFGAPPPGLKAPLSSRMMLRATQVLRLVLLCAAVGAAAAALFAIVGAIAVSPDLAGSWATRAGEDPNYVAREIGDIPLLGQHAETVTVELLLVAGAIGAIAALAFSVELVTGERLREEVLSKRFAGYANAFRAWARLYHGTPPAVPEPEPPPEDQPAASASSSA